jgi:hypothetical protein
MWMAAAAALGKLGGGWLADRVGWRRWSILALGTAAPLLLFSAGRPILAVAGVMALQSTTPLMLAALGQMWSNAPATAAGLGLGLAVALGGAPVMAGVHLLAPNSGGWIAGAGALLALLGLGMALRQGAEASAEHRPGVSALRDVVC